VGVPFVHELRVRYGECAGLSRLGTTGITTEVGVHRDGELLVEGRLRHVCVDAETLAKRELPDWIRSGLEPLLIAR
jgi:acyl-CoA thioesterase FadM